MKSEPLTTPAESPAAGRGPELLRRPRIAAILTWLERVADSPWFAYGSIFLIQSKVLWGIWQFRDLTNGDTASYFRNAELWADGFNIEPLLSPLYVVFYGSLTWLIPDAYDVTIIHRVLIVLAATLLVLAVLRRLLPPGIAWVLAVWWAVLPINYDTVYEIHLFALLPTLVAVFLALSWSGLAMRGTVFAILLGSAILVRNELVVAALTWAVIWGGYEIWRRRKSDAEPRPPKEVAIALALPAVIVAAVMVAVVPPYLGRDQKGLSADTKQGVIFCQNFTYGAKQRGDYFEQLSFNKPLSCRALMTELFDTPLPSWSEAIQANPGAVGEHLWWNAQLIPQGLELMLFDQISGSQQRNPDVVPVTNSSPAALVGLLAVAAFVAWGMILLWRERRRWWEDWLRERAWGWAAMISLAVAAVGVMLIIRPRPSYLFNMSVLLLALIGMSAYVIGSRWKWPKRARAALPLLAVATVIAVPSLYDARYQTPQAGLGRPLLEMVTRLEPFRTELNQPETHLLAPQFAAEACVYVGAGCRSTSFLQAIQQRPKGTSIPKVMKDLGINLIYADELIISNPSTRDFLQKLEEKGWEPLGPSLSSGEQWTLLRSPTSASADGS